MSIVGNIECNGPAQVRIGSLQRSGQLPIATIEAVGKPGAAQDLRKFARTFLEWCVSSGRAHSNVLAGLRQPKRSRA
jgi:hypothetical protein